MKKLRHASLFSGIGGPEVAAAMLGWENVFHCEINPFGRAVLGYWFPESQSYEDITKTDFTKYRGQIDILTGGFPCQPFSYAGKRGGQSDDRYLWPEMLRVIDEIRPTWVVCENVAGITTMVESCEISEMGSEASLFEEDNGVHRFRAELTFTIERICRDLESKGYAVQPVLIPACAVGAPHRRDRVFIVAHSSGSGSESHTQDGRSESDGSDELSQSGKWREQTELDNGFHAVPRHSSNTYGRRGCEVDEHIQSELSDGTKFCDGWFGITTNPEELHGNGGSAGYGGAGFFEKESELRNICRKTASDTYCKRPQGRHYCNKEGHREAKSGSVGFLHCDKMLPGNRWEGFPSVSLAHRGNDGLPFDVDDLTIPFARWRNESLKAYGNAIVPQVMYRIFQCIEEIEHEPS